VAGPGLAQDSAVGDEQDGDILDQATITGLAQLLQGANAGGQGDPPQLER
jgi:hypothetical protein